MHRVRTGTHRTDEHRSPRNRRRRRPPAQDAEPPSGALVNLAETEVIKEGNIFMVSRRDGSLPVGTPHPLGLYRDDCRFLSGHELFVNRVRPRLLVASAASGRSRSTS